MLTLLNQFQHKWLAGLFVDVVTTFTQYCGGKINEYPSDALLWDLHFTDKNLALCFPVFFDRFSCILLNKYLSDPVFPEELFLNKTYLLGNTYCLLSKVFKMLPNQTLKFMF